MEELESLPEEWLQNLASLVTTKIWGCHKLQISPLFQQLTVLQNLQISNCMELINNENEEGTQCLGPTTLPNLYIEMLQAKCLSQWSFITLQWPEKLRTVLD